jgi:NAD(P)-dependent dehydrogenase (short-subunit alcohol dehydrogenase family)
MTVMVTGAAGGVGSDAYAAAQRLFADVKGHDLPPTAETGLAIAGDLLDSAVIDDIEREATSTGPLESVIVAHGMAGAGRLGEIDRRLGRKLIDVNFSSVIALWERLRPHLERSQGTFVVIVSQVANYAEAGNGFYCASKSAVAGYFRGLSDSTTARVRLIHPGGIQTPLLRRALEGTAEARGISYDEIVAERYSSSPAGRVSEPREIADALLWAARLDAPGLVELSITGGETLW